MPRSVAFIYFLEVNVGTELVLLLQKDKMQCYGLGFLVFFFVFLWCCFWFVWGFCFVGGGGWLFLSFFFFVSSPLG